MKLTWIAFWLLLPLLSLAQTEENVTQIEKGKWLVGGTAAFSSRKWDGADKRRTVYDLSTKLGYFVTKNVALGAEIGFNSGSYISARPFARFYYQKNFLQAKYIYNVLGTDSYSGFDISLGRAFFLKDNVAFEPELYYNSIGSSIGNISDIGLRVGFQFYW